jgi:hypothetical protein
MLSEKKSKYAEAKFRSVLIVASPARLDEQAGQKIDRCRYKDQAEKSPIPPSVEYETASENDDFADVATPGNGNGGNGKCQ